MPEDFRKIVFEAYEKKKIEGKLSSNLLDPTPGNLREECIIVCRERYISSDHEVLRLFFSNVDKEKGYLNVLENSLAEEFKQMSKILRGRVTKPGIKYFELLAWLIDFHPRTSTSYYKSFYTEPNVEAENSNWNDTEVKDINNNLVEALDYTHDNNPAADNKTDHQEDERPTDKNGSNGPIIKVNGQEVIKENARSEVGELGEEQIKAPMNKMKAAVASFIILALVSGGTYLMSSIGAGSACMYWTGDHYQSIGCKIKKSDTLIVPLDEYKLANFKRITRPDTLTKKDLGKVWYMKIKADSVEFYTDSGDYPMDTRRKLKPITEYMLDKYVIRK